MNCATSSLRCARNLLGISVHYLSETNGKAMRITTARFCRKCGAAIPPDSPQQSCGACLIETGLGSDEAVAGVDDPGRRSPMLMDFGDYELLEQIGRGGQGVVFRARQKSLNRIVALKVIGLGQWATEAHLKRFRLEAEAAASLEHPGIVPIHEVGERDGSCYFSMKFVEGGQLDEVARREPMPIRRAVELIAKVARTVYYAHEHGILHRDIKPGNILLDAKGEPHLTDFGLARLVESQSSVTHTLDVLGTPSYMAPEQAAGNNAAFSSATDVYGLGAVLYQLLTGQPPFAGGTTYETIKLLLDTEPRQPRLINPKIDRDLATICLKCLEKDPKRRYSSALALAEDLERWLKHEPIQARRTGIFTRGRKWVRRNPAIAALIASLAALICWNIWESELISHPATKSVAVLPFENLSPDPDNAYFANGIQDEILTRLARIADLKVISRTSTQHYQSKPRNLREIAKQLGVANILEGTVQRAADQVRVNVQLVNAQTDSHLWADTFDRKLTDIFAVESEVAKTVAKQLQAKLTGQEEQVIAVKPTDNTEAYNAYLRGRAFSGGSPFDKSNVERTIQSYQEAVKLDPNFALAWAYLSCAQSGSYWLGQDSSPAQLTAARDAADRALALDPNLPETHLALGYYRYYGQRDYTGALAEFQQAERGLPNSVDVIKAIALVQRRLRRWEDAIGGFRRVIELDPRYDQGYENLAATYLSLRRFPEALATADRALAFEPTNAEALGVKVFAFWAMGDLQAVERLLANPGTEPLMLGGSTVPVRGAEGLFQRRYAAAIEIFSTAVAAAKPDNPNIDVKLFLGLSQQRAGDVAAARATYQTAVQHIQRELEKVAPDSYQAAAMRTGLGLAYAGLGKAASAIAEGQKAMAIHPTSKDPFGGPEEEDRMARIYALLGDADHAIPILRRLLQIPYGAAITPSLLRLDPMFDPLRNDPRFQKLCEGKQP
jgi:serine/threonine protein kinase/Tfp pilus assembly protein PilF